MLDSLFYFGCIPSRILYAILVNTYPRLWFLNLIIATYFFYKYLTWRGEKGFFGGVLWWNNMRLVHSIVFLLAIWYPKLLYVDVILGILARLYHTLKTQ